MADLTNRYARFRIREPKLFVKSSLRIQDIGRPQHTKRIAGRLKKTGKWETQSVLVSRPDYEKGTRVFKKNGRFEIIQ